MNAPGVFRARVLSARSIATADPPGLSTIAVSRTSIVDSRDRRKNTRTERSITEISRRSHFLISTGIYLHSISSALLQEIIKKSQYIHRYFITYQTILFLALPVKFAGAYICMCLDSFKNI